MSWRVFVVAAVAAYAFPAVSFAGEIPDLSIGYSWGGTSISEGGMYDLRVGWPPDTSTYTWPGGSASGLLYKGAFQNGAVRRDGHALFGSGSQNEYSEYFPEQGEYFVVVYYAPWWADQAWGRAVDEWFKNGTSTDPNAFPPDSWGIIRFRVGQAPVLPTIANLAQYRKLGIESIDAGSTFLGNAAVFKADIEDPDSDAVRLEVEVKKLGVTFSGEDTMVSDVLQGGRAEVIADELIPAAEQYATGGNEAEFHWRARAVDGDGNASQWVEYGDVVSAPDFAVKAVPLWTQVQSEYPKRSAADEWFDSLYASGEDSDCSPANPEHATIASCGCAITSAVMVANYFGVRNGSDGNPINPKSINDWLKANNGYSDDNRVIWTKVEEYLGVKINGEPHKVLALDLEHFKTSSHDVVDSYLDTQVPVIAYKGSLGHYFVLDGKMARQGDTTYSTRDPQWFNTHTLDDTKNMSDKVQAYGNAFTHATIFTKLASPKKIASHVELYLASPAEILVTDPEGRRTGLDPRTGERYEEIPQSLYFLEDPIVSSEDEFDPEAKHTVKVLQLPSLDDGTYTIEIIGTGYGPYTFSSYRTDRFGSTTRDMFLEVTELGNVHTYSLKIEGGEPVITSLSLSDLLDLLRAAIERAVEESKEAKGLLGNYTALIQVIDKDTDASHVILSNMVRSVERLQQKRELSPPVADTIRSLLLQIEEQL